MWKERTCNNSRLVSLVFPICLALTAPSPAATAEPVTYREIAARVVDEAKQPVAHLPVRLMAVSRDSMWSMGSSEEMQRKARGWEFTTDADGRFTARFGKFLFGEHEQATDLIEPGYGHFYFVVEEEEGYAGGVSEEVLNLNDEELASRKEEDARDCPPQISREVDPHFHSGVRVLTDAPLGESLEIMLKRGLDVTGQMIDPQGKPLAREEVTVLTDMGADTHTGWGGEIFEQMVETDRAGRFVFHHVYPAVFTLQTINRGSTRPYWIRTRVRSRWVDKAEDVITPKEDETLIPVVIVASREPTYRYFGRLTDERGHGIAGAQVEVRCSMHEPELTYSDDHDMWWKTKTDRDGDYSVLVGYRFANAIWITAEGTQGGGESPQDNELYAPGRYDFTLKREKK